MTGLLSIKQCILFFSELVSTVLNMLAKGVERHGEFKSLTTLGRLYGFGMGQGSKNIVYFDPSRKVKMWTTGPVVVKHYNPNACIVKGSTVT